MKHRIPGVGGGTLIISYILRLGSFISVQNFEFQYFWDFQKNKYFWVCRFCGYFWGVITKMDFI